MKILLENDRLILCLEGRIDSSNAAAVEAELFSNLESHPGMDFAIDAGSCPLTAD